MKYGDYDKLAWRHHGTGMLQTYLPDGRRVHAWHPDLIYPEVFMAGGHVHNHRYDINSYVVTGKVGSTSYQFALAPHGAWMLYECVHFQKQVCEHGQSLKPFAQAREIGERYTTVYGAGQSYFIPKGVFHGSHIVDFALTIVTREKVDENASALVAGLKDMGIRYCFSEDGGRTHSNRPEMTYDSLTRAERYVVDMAREPLLYFLMEERALPKDGDWKRSKLQRVVEGEGAVISSQGIPGGGRGGATQ